MKLGHHGEIFTHRSLQRLCSPLGKAIHRFLCHLGSEIHNQYICTYIFSFEIELSGSLQALPFLPRSRFEFSVFGGSVLKLQTWNRGKHNLLVLCQPIIILWSANCNV